MEGRKAESGEMGSDDIYHQGIIPLLGGATGSWQSWWCPPSVLSRWRLTEEWYQADRRGMEAAEEAGGCCELRARPQREKRELRDPPRLRSEQRLGRLGCGDGGVCTCYNHWTVDQWEARIVRAGTNQRTAERDSCQLWSSLWWRELTPERDTRLPRLHGAIAREIKLTMRDVLKNTPRYVPSKIYVCGVG